MLDVKVNFYVVLVLDLGLENPDQQFFVSSGQIFSSYEEIFGTE